MSKKILGALLCVAMLSAGLVGCSSSASNTSVKESEETKSAEYESLNFDNYGREVVVTEKPKKVLTLGPNSY